MTLLTATYLLRAWGARLIAVALAEATVVGWVAWYLVEVTWSSAPLSASRTPLHAVTFSGAWGAALLGLLAMGPLIGAAAVRGPWIGVDPTLALPIGSGNRLVSSWAAASVTVAVAAAAPVPVYLALYEMGAFAPAEIGQPLVLHAAAIVLGPLAGIVPSLALRGR
jgi:hypothetical protein